MVAKALIVRELGENGLLLPGAVDRALQSNDRAKYFLALLGSARVHADDPRSGLPNLSADRARVGEKRLEYDSVIQRARKLSDGKYSIPLSGEVVRRLLDSCEEMLGAVQIAGGPEARKFDARLKGVRQALGAPREDVVTGPALDLMLSGDRAVSESLHVLIMDLHKEILRIQAGLRTENVEGAATYSLRSSDTGLVRAFMVGVNRTAGLKFDHPGLGTTATRIGRRLVIQNDIGESDVHVIIVSIEDGAVQLTYSDLHPPRVAFLQEMLAEAPLEWGDQDRRVATKRLGQDRYQVVVGTAHPSSRAELCGLLTLIGSRLVFLIDWNRARKQLRTFVKNSDGRALLSWAAKENLGHRGFLSLGGSTLINEAIELAPKGLVRYGERLSDIIGRERAMDFFRWSLRTASEGLQANKPGILLRDEIKAQLLRSFHSMDEDLLGLCQEHVSLLVEVALSIQETLAALNAGPAPEKVQRNTAKAKAWEKSADEIVGQVRAMTRRAGGAQLFHTLIGVSDDALDSLEEAAFSLSLGADHIHVPKIFSELYHLSQIAASSAREFLKAVSAIKLLRLASTEEDLQGFLSAVDRVLSLEEACDVALRDTLRAIWTESSDFKEISLAIEIAEQIEESTNFLKRASFTIKDDVFERMNRGRLPYNVA